MQREQLLNLNANTILNTGTTTTTDFTITTYPPSKKEIIQRLFTEGHISFDEMWILILDDPEVKLVPMPYEAPVSQPFIFPQPFEPYDPPEYPWTVTITGSQTGESGTI